MTSHSGTDSNRAPRTLFVTGTDTGVGKTHVTCLIAAQLIARGYCVGAYKPVCSGAIVEARANDPSNGITPARWEDIERLSEAVGGRWPDDVICPQRFLAAVAPPVAARMEGKTVSFSQIIQGAARFEGADILLIEGAGGWLSPLTETRPVADIAAVLKCPVLIVARAGLGTINHSLLTIESIRSCGLEVAGVVLNEATVPSADESINTNADEIEGRSGVPVFGTVQYGCRCELHRNGKLVTIMWEHLASKLHFLS